MTIQLDFFGEIGWEITAEEFIPKMRAAEDKARALNTDVQLLINSFGGQVIAGNAIITQIRMSDVRYTALITGIAASMATQIASNTDHVEIAENAWFMIHYPSTQNMSGEADDLRKEADVLDSMTSQTLKSLQTHSKMPDGQLFELLKKPGTMLNADEALELGFVHGIVAKAEEQQVALISAPVLKKLKKSFENNNKALDVFFKERVNTATETLPKPKPKPEAKMPSTEEMQNAIKPFFTEFGNQAGADYINAGFDFDTAKKVNAIVKKADEKITELETALETSKTEHAAALKEANDKLTVLQNNGETEPAEPGNPDEDGAGEKVDVKALIDAKIEEGENVVNASKAVQKEHPKAFAEYRSNPPKQG